MSPSPADEPVLDDHEVGELEELLGQLVAADRSPAVRPWEEAHGRALELVTQLHLTATRQAQVGASGGGGEVAGDPAEQDHGEVSVRVAPLPYVPHASDVAEQLHGVLSGWVARTLRADRDEAPIGPRRRGPNSASTPALAAWLLGRLHTLQHRPGSTREELAVLRRLVARGRSIIDREVERRYLGQCWTPLRDEDGNLIIAAGEQAFCYADVYARPHDRKVACPSCGAIHVVDKRRENLLDLARPRLERAADVSRALTSLDNPVTAERIRQWARRGRLHPAGRATDGKPLYRIGDVIDLLTADAQRIARRTTNNREETRPA